MYIINEPNKFKTVNIKKNNKNKFFFIHYFMQQLPIIPNRIE